MSPVFLVLGLAAGCKPPPAAPAALDDLSRYLYREWADDDTAVQAAGLTNLEDFLAEADLAPATPLDARSWALADLDDADVATLPKRPDVPLDGAVGMGIAWSSDWPVDCHATLQIQADQLPYEPSATTYVRHFLAPTDPTCFVSGACDQVDTNNDVRRKNLLFAFTFVLWKSFRWIDYTSSDGTSRRAFYSRSWLEQSYDGEGGKTRMVQSYSIDAWLPRDDGRTWRYQTLWSETDLGADVSEGIELGTIKGGTDQLMQTGDTAIGAQGLCTAERRVPDDQ